ncbi:TetR/AcrR family transcriptional regulator [Flavobacterium sp.]|uniref:TetR/AcrR family transcriptional regulator n=1 Tax=Flavobacterium sp. TaxID=239 RepID=UPI0037510DEA
MKSRKDDILEVALRLFNEKGIDSVTTRDIAKELKISLGNLTYYFPFKKDIVLALAQHLAIAVDEALAINANRATDNILLDYFNQIEAIFITQFKYQFIVHKRYGEIITSFPEVQKFVQDFLKVRFDSWEQLSKQLVKQKFAKSNLVEDCQSHSYILNILALYWHQEFLIYSPNLTDKQKVQKALSIFFQSYKPYLTQKGLDTINPLLIKLDHYQNENRPNN